MRLLPGPASAFGVLVVPFGRQGIEGVKAALLNQKGALLRQPAALLRGQRGREGTLGGASSRAAGNIHQIWCKARPYPPPLV